ncbi:PKD-like domain-containing protein [Marinitoga lauensis]|uniref:PKD-like domain-containing protein n=1 Tax=Marinitoga lauensis TaxID=2201189 RepID=UPI001010D530|nr:PKD-like domain-containing protein [Marinitoga lauensis]
MDTPLKIEFFAKDKYDHVAQTEVNVFVKQPKLKIIAPANNSKFAAGESIEFKVISQDLDDDIIWYDNGTEIGRGDSFEYTFNETGEHSIEAISGDYSDSITIFIEALPVLTGEETEFETYINEPISLNVNYENLNPEEIQWLLNGRIIGSGAELEYTFDQPGEYTIIAKYKDLYIEFYIKVKAIPQIRIIAPLNNAKIKAGEEITLKSEAKNTEEDIIWYLDDVEIGRGEKINYVFSNDFEGIHTLKVESGIASNEITIEIYVERSVKIINPESKLLVIDINKTYSFKAERKNIEEEIQWSINDEFVGRGDTLEYTFTNSGEFIVKAEAGGFSDEVTVKVVGEKYLIIKNPLDGAKFEIGENIKFSVDAKNVTDDIIWYANGEEIGKGIAIEYAFNEAGSYEITAKSGELENTITIEILLPENLKITSPEDGAEFFIGKEVEFVAEGENLRSDIQWFVNDVLIGSGDSITYTFNTAGKYEIKAKTKTVESTIRIKILESQTLNIISPKNGDMYKVGETIKLKANTKYDAAIEWYANDDYLGEGNEFDFTQKNLENMK